MHVLQENLSRIKSASKEIQSLVRATLKQRRHLCRRTPGLCWLSKVMCAHKYIYIATGTKRIILVNRELFAQNLGQLCCSRFLFVSKHQSDDSWLYESENRFCFLISFKKFLHKIQKNISCMVN